MCKDAADSEQEPSIFRGWVSIFDGGPHRQCVERMDDSSDAKDKVSAYEVFLIATDDFSVKYAAVIWTIEIEWVKARVVKFHHVLIWYN